MAFPKLFLSLVLTWSFLSSIAVARAPPTEQSLAARLQVESPDCWGSLIELKACTGEVILFFMNGETYLGPSCCRAIRIIEKQCWPTMLLSLGFTSQEGDILKDYCDEPASHPPPPGPEVPSIGPSLAPSSALGASGAP
ncbi:egg cell-secreted protein 1.4-like [Magnolia sinica]|uniref:egg cell-secreted protein 1.4-like n=1 Tax=Magnolia sinica TaxID=86752 RepID=UPI002658F737|nr:egg cell-secreted protein 1.4-like [Magnolia sinica]